ncbi:TniQ family protein [Salimicrobium flavidum]|uniref:TniQ protein n=1 Tax=Salimicrobium flavidum TaxID=570947 RepID=A0A1N7J2G1_9BACI|nr:TniQ family protein [Salimicrobium flavidum]SIS43552.1 TniQ protein [Salimicrobium flavidum]
MSGNRSFLYSLNPIGIGTNSVESITSYIKRISDEHLVPSTRLLDFILEKYGDSGYLRRYNFKGKKVSKILTNTEFGLKFLEALTFSSPRDDLHYMTMLNLSRMLNKLKFNEYRKWCPMCIEKMKEDGGIFYEPLIWTIYDVKYCKEHNVYLSERCEHCNSKLNHIHPSNLIAFCYNCHSFLGGTGVRIDSNVEVIDKHNLNNFEELIAKIPNMNSCPVKLFNTFFIRNLKDRTGSIEVIAEASGVKESTVYAWIRGDYSPKVQNILNISYSFDISVYDLMFQKGIEKITKGQISNSIPLKRTAAFEYTSGLDIVGSDVEVRRLFIEKELDRALKTKIPISKNDFLIKVNISERTLRKYQNKKVNELVQRYEEYQKNEVRKRENETKKLIYEAIMLLHSNDVYPSVDTVAAKINSPNVFRIQKYNKYRKELLEELGYNFDEA